MTKLAVRFSLLLLCLAAIGGAAFLAWSSSRTLDASASALRRFEIDARAAAVGVVEMRAAQQAYVAVNQGEDFWFARVSAIKKEVDDRLAALHGSNTAAEATTQIEAASTLLQEFMQMDLRARDYTRGRQLALASDMVFADGFELTRKAGDAIERALTAEEVGHDAVDAAIRRQQAMALAGAAGLSLLGLLVLVPVRKLPAPAAELAPVLAPITPVSKDLPADLNDFALVTRPDPPKPQIDLVRVAALCADLARVPDTRGLPALLERAATILDATGIVLWIADPDGRELAPTLVHGYPPQMAVRLGSIARNAENVTASAYRTSLLQTIKGDTISSGAIAVPLVATSGCVGVMAAEVKNGGEQQEALLAAASIIAAQLATLVGPPSARAKIEAAG